jgi:hypothetical protein
LPEGAGRYRCIKTQTDCFGPPGPRMRVHIRESHQPELSGVCCPPGWFFRGEKVVLGRLGLFWRPGPAPERGVDHRLGLSTLCFFNRNSGRGLRGRSFPPGFRPAVVLPLFPTLTPADRVAGLAPGPAPTSVCCGQASPPPPANRGALSSRRRIRPPSNVHDDVSGRPFTSRRQRRGPIDAGGASCLVARVTRTEGTVSFAASR